MHDWQWSGYWLGGLALAALTAVFAWSYAVYRGRKRRTPPKATRAATPGDGKPPVAAGAEAAGHARSLALMGCAVAVTALIVLGLTWISRSAAFSGDRTQMATSASQRH